MTIKLIALPPLSLYIHFPWCEKKCPYCDFNSHQIKDTGFDEARYLRALIQDLQTESFLRQKKAEANAKKQESAELKEKLKDDLFDFYSQYSLKL